MRRRRRGGSLEYWVKAIEKARMHGLETASRLSREWTRLRRILEDRLEASAPYGGRIYKLQYTGAGPLSGAISEAGSATFYGVDSSIVKPIRVGVKYVTFLSSAAVRLDPGKPRRATIVHLDVDPEEVPEAGDLSTYKAELTLKMFNKELRALREARKDSNSVRGPRAVVLDGPLIDPPTLASRLSRSPGLAEKAEALVRDRADQLAMLYRSGVDVVGFVKRLQGSIFLDEYLGSEADNFRGAVGDRLLAMALASLMVEKADEYGICSSGDKVVIVTRPVEASTRYAGDADLYNSVIGEASGGARIYTSLYVPLYCDGNRRRPARIEFIARPGEEDGAAARIAAMLEAVTVPGSYLPLPVLLAHRSCTIRSREGRKLLRELVSRHIVEALNQQAPTLLDLFHD